MTALDELAALELDIRRSLPLNPEPEAIAHHVAKWLHKDGYRKPRTITTAEELDALPYGTVVLHDEGWNVTVAQRQAEDMRWYVTGCLEYIRPEALLPAAVLHEGNRP